MGNKVKLTLPDTKTVLQTPGLYVTTDWANGQPNMSNELVPAGVRLYNLLKDIGYFSPGVSASPIGNNKVLVEPRSPRPATMIELAAPDYRTTAKLKDTGRNIPTTFINRQDIPLADVPYTDMTGKTVIKPYSSFAEALKDNPAAFNGLSDEEYQDYMDAMNPSPQFSKGNGLGPYVRTLSEMRGTTPEVEWANKERAHKLQILQNILSNGVLDFSPLLGREDPELQSLPWVLDPNDHSKRLYGLRAINNAIANGLLQYYDSPDGSKRLGTTMQGIKTFGDDKYHGRVYWHDKLNTPMLNYMHPLWGLGMGERASNEPWFGHNYIYDINLKNADDTTKYEYPDFDFEKLLKAEPGRYDAGVTPAYNDYKGLPVRDAKGKLKRYDYSADARRANKRRNRPSQEELDDYEYDQYNMYLNAKKNGASETELKDLRNAIDSVQDAIDKHHSVSFTTDENGKKRILINENNIFDRGVPNQYSERPISISTGTDKDGNSRSMEIANMYGIPITPTASSADRPKVKVRVKGTTEDLSIPAQNMTNEATHYDNSDKVYDRDEQRKIEANKDRLEQNTMNSERVQERKAKDEAAANKQEKEYREAAADPKEQARIAEAMDSKITMQANRQKQIGGDLRDIYSANKVSDYEFNKTTKTAYDSMIQSALNTIKRIKGKDVTNKAGLREIVPIEDFSKLLRENRYEAHTAMNKAKDLIYRKYGVTNDMIRAASKHNTSINTNILKGLGAGE